MAKPFEKVAIVGTGILGAQIAMLAAHAGYTVKVYDPREEAFLETYNKIKDGFDCQTGYPVHSVGRMGKVQNGRPTSDEPG